MSCVVERQHTDEAVEAKFKPTNTTIRGGEPDGAQGWGVERAHEVEGEDADRAGVGEDGDSAALIGGDGAVEGVGGAVE